MKDESNQQMIEKLDLLKLSLQRTRRSRIVFQRGLVWVYNITWWVLLAIHFHQLALVNIKKAQSPHLEVPWSKSKSESLGLRSRKKARAGTALRRKLMPTAKSSVGESSYRLHIASPMLSPNMLTNTLGWKASYNVSQLPRASRFLIVWFTYIFN